MPKPQDVIKVIASSLHQRHLKGLGFGKSGRTWIRSTDWPQVINIQLSSFNSAEDARFTINVGISIPNLRDAWGSPLVRDHLKEYDCDMRSRIGSLLPENCDKWWDVSSSSDPDHLVHEVFVDISGFVLPWFNRLTTYDEVAAELNRRKQWAKAAVAFHLGGDLKAAEASMIEAFAEAHPLALPRLRQIARKCSIPLPDR